MTRSTFCFDLECSSDQSEQGCIEGDGAVAVEGHVHANQSLRTRCTKSFGPKKGINKTFFFDSVRDCMYLARSTMRTELAKA